MLILLWEYYFSSKFFKKISLFIKILYLVYKKKVIIFLEFSIIENKKFIILKFNIIIKILLIFIIYYFKNQIKSW